MTGVRMEAAGLPCYPRLMGRAETTHARIAFRNAGIGDEDILAPFARGAFDAAFGHLYPPEDLAAFFAGSRSEETYRGQLADPSTRVRLACEGDALVAYALVTIGEGFEERPQPRPERPLFLSQLYCGPRTTGRGIGAALMDWVLETARAEGCDAVQLSVFSENHGAQSFYRRRGFRHVADIDYWVGNTRDDEYLYELELPTGPHG